MCDKTVYKPEELIAVGQVWHDKCFTCGGKNNDGCGRVMKRDGYVDHSGQPYCSACYNKLFRTKGFGYGNSLNTDYGGASAPSPAANHDHNNAHNMSNLSIASRSSDKGDSNNVNHLGSKSGDSVGNSPFLKPATSSPPPPSSAPPAPPAPSASSLASHSGSSENLKRASFLGNTGSAHHNTSGTGFSPAPSPNEHSHSITHSRPSFSSPSAPKCTSCAKSVFQMEQVIAVGRTWHNACFTCGGTSARKDGCGKVLKRDGYVDHDNQPYCQACYSKLFRPKGFGYGNTLSTDYGPSSTSSKSHDDDLPVVTEGQGKVTSVDPMSMNKPKAPGRPAPPAAPSAPAPPSAPSHAAPTPPAPAAPAPPAPVPSAAASHKEPDASGFDSKPKPPPMPSHTPQQSAFAAFASVVNNVNNQGPSSSNLPPSGPPEPSPVRRPSSSNPLIIPAIDPSSVKKGSVKIGKGATVHQEASYIGDNDEVDESEW
jgi:NAD-dependent SIR2 family protein deacetylase